VPAPTPSAGAAAAGEGEEQARRARSSSWSPVFSSSPPQSPAADRSGALTDGERGPSIPGAHLPAPVMPAVADMHDIHDIPDTSGCAADNAGTTAQAESPAESSMRTLRPARGVPAPRYDGSAAALEVPLKLAPPATCTLHTDPVQTAGGSVAGERNYLAEVEELVSEEERAFDDARKFLANNYCEVLSTEAAPKFQRSAPRTLEEALSRPDAPQWREACHSEMTALAAKEVMTLMMLPPNKKAISLRWVFSYKLRPDGNIERYKARLVAKGFTQQEGIDYFEVWAPTGRLSAYRALLAHAAYYGLEVKLLDFTTAFLNGPLEEEIYVKQPPGFEDNTGRVMRLNRALYGLKQAANAWHKAFVTAMVQIGYRRCVVDPAVFVRKCSKGTCIVHSHVDDCAGCGPPGEIDKDFKQLLSQFEGRELGEVDGQVFLGMYHERDWDKGVIHLSQPRHIDTVLSAHGVTGRPVRTPLDHKVVLLPTTEHDKKEHPLLGKYAAIVGSVMYIANSTRPDLCYSASMLARFMANPCDAHLEQAMHLLRYLLKTKDYRLALGGSGGQNGPLTVWGDSDWANCPETRRSVSGLVVQIHGSSVFWRSCKQSSVAKSTMIAEYYAASTAADECIYFANLLQEMGYGLGRTPLMQDNESAATIERNPVVNDKSKYAELHAHYVRELVERGEIEVMIVPTEEMIADCMTKALTPQKHAVACGQLKVG
jgi:Reverse transcriptase (RNA-dependent DNA polymerase)